MAHIGTGNIIGRKMGISWSRYWATLISATVEDAAPTNVVLTFPSGKPSLLSTDITATINGVNDPVVSASWSGGVWTIVLTSAVIYGDVVVMTFVKTGETANVTNNVLYTMLLTKQGTGVGVAVLMIQASSDVTLTLGTNAKFYSNAAGTLDESATWVVTSGALRTRYIKCTTGTATMTFSDVSKLTKWGGEGAGLEGWQTANANCPKMTASLEHLTITHLNLSGYTLLSDSQMPTTLTYLRLYNYITATITWTSTSDLPDGLTYLSLWCTPITLTTTYNPANLTYILLWGNNVNITFAGTLNNSMTVLDIDTTPSTLTINGALPTSLTDVIFLACPHVTWTYSGALPAGLRQVYLRGGKVNWTYSGALPATLVTLNIYSLTMVAGSHIYWTSTDALPANVNFVELVDNDIDWSYAGSMPTGLTYCQIYGSKINYTGDFAGTGNLAFFRIYDFRTSDMDDAGIITLLTNLTNRVGGFPATVIIGDYLNYASPPGAVTTAINTFKAAKSVTTVTLLA